MKICLIQPRFGETNISRHIHYAVLLDWFETARNDIYRIFNPHFEDNNWRLVIGHVECDYYAETILGAEVEIHTKIEHIGNSSFTVLHKCYQLGKLTAEGRLVLIYIDLNTKQSAPLPMEIKQELENF